MGPFPLHSSCSLSWLCCAIREDGLLPQDHIASQGPSTGVTNLVCYVTLCLEAPVHPNTDVAWTEVE